MGNQSSNMRTCCHRLKSYISTQGTSTDLQLQPEHSSNKLVSLDTLNHLTREKALGPNVLGTFLNFTYQKGQEIGSGPHGTVYEALCSENGEIVAEKKIICVAEERRRVYSYFEAKLMNLNHENLLRYFDIYESIDNANDLYLVSRMTSGCSLKEALNNFQGFEEKIVRIFCKEILQGLIYLNKHKVWHSNLKPNNILIEANGHIKISDFFTISKKLLNFKGKSDYRYKAPEMIMNRPKSIKTDVWSLGCIVIEMLTNEFIWPNDLKEIHDKFKKNVGPQIPLNITPQCSDFLRKCLDMDESRRPSPEELFLHEFIQKEKEPDEKERIFIRGLSLFGSPLKKKLKSTIKTITADSVVYNHVESEEHIKGNNGDFVTNVIKGRTMEESINFRLKNELERKKFEEELFNMINVEE